jgi:hypothetical protein
MIEPELAPCTAITPSRGDLIGTLVRPSQHENRRRISAVLLASAVLLLASSALAQRVQLGAEGVVQSENLGRAFETFSIFGALVHKSANSLKSL